MRARERRRTAGESMVDGRAAGAGLGSTRQKKAHRPSQALIQTTHAVSPRRSEDALAAGGSRPAAPGVVWLLRRRRRRDRRGAVSRLVTASGLPCPTGPSHGRPLERVRPATRLPTRLPPARGRAHPRPVALEPHRQPAMVSAKRSYLRLPAPSPAQPTAPPCASGRSGSIDGRLPLFYSRPSSQKNSCFLPRLALPPLRQPGLFGLEVVLVFVVPSLRPLVARQRRGWVARVRATRLLARRAWSVVRRWRTIS
jgi:hypothetical protein